MLLLSLVDLIQHLFVLNGFVARPAIPPVIELWMLGLVRLLSQRHLECDTIRCPVVSFVEWWSQLPLDIFHFMRVRINLYYVRLDEIKSLFPQPLWLAPVWVGFLRLGGRGLRRRWFPSQIIVFLIIRRKLIRLGAIRGAFFARKSLFLIGSF